MAAREPTHTQLAAKLLVEASLNQIAGRGAAKLPVQGVQLSDAKRAELGREPGGKTIFYALTKGGVYMDFQGAATTVWFDSADSSDARVQVEEELKRAYPEFVVRSDQADPRNEKMRLRAYDIGLGNGRAAAVDIAYPGPGSNPRGFVARVLAYEINFKT